MHRDLKPGNILINSKCVVKICDFGLARTVPVEEEIRTSNINKFGKKFLSIFQTETEKERLSPRILSRPYRCPEVLLMQKTYDYKVDMWSLGCVLGELIRYKTNEGLAL